MSIYAANNILCGIKNLNPQGRQIAGIIYNSRGVGDDRKYVEDFTNAVNLPILAEIPRSNLFTQAEKEAMTLVEKSPKSAEANIFLELAQNYKRSLFFMPLPLYLKSRWSFLCVGKDYPTLPLQFPNIHLLP